MAKNNWINGDTFTRTSVNQPFWLASGTYNAGADRIELQVSPGAIRYPWKPAVMYSGQAQPLLINNPQAAKYYSVFVRSDGSMMVSGTTALTPVPAPPRYDAEPLGIVFTGASLGTANMVGPWNQGTFGTYEQRGQAVASTPPRITYRAYTTRSVLNSGHITAVSGIAWLTMADSNTRNLATYISASVTWEPSGIPAANGQLVATPQFLVGNGSILLFDSTASIGLDNRIFTTPQTGGLTTLVTSNITAVAPSGSFDGYALRAGLGTGTATIFVRDVVFSAVAGLYKSDTNEPA